MRLKQLFLDLIPRKMGSAKMQISDIFFTLIFDIQILNCLAGWLLTSTGWKQTKMSKQWNRRQYETDKGVTGKAEQS